MRLEEIRHMPPYEPKTGFERWLDRRLPIVRFVHYSFIDYPTPKNLNYWWAFGGILTVMLAVQILTGIVLAMHYTPQKDLAFASVEHIMRDVNYGWLMRYIHANGASMFFLAVYIHMFRSLYYGSYKEPRELMWMLGVVIFLLLIATAFMGYVLPWGQMSYWAATVITNLFTAFDEVMPGLGSSIRTLLLGGFSVDNPTLNRFFALHYLLPFAVLGVVTLHIWALHVLGNNNPAGVDVKAKKDTVPFFPHYVIKDFFAMVVFFVLFAAFAFFNPNGLGHPDNYIPANPLSTPPHIVPEWYFLPFYAMLRAINFDFFFISSKLGGVIVMLSSILVLFVLPWLDTSKVRSMRYRPAARVWFFIFVATCIALGYLGSKPTEGAYVFWAQIATAYYFLYFLVIVPLVGRFEQPKPIPKSISESVLRQSSVDA